MGAGGGLRRKALIVEVGNAIKQQVLDAVNPVFQSHFSRMDLIESRLKMIGDSLGVTMVKTEVIIEELKLDQEKIQKEVLEKINKAVEEAKKAQDALEKEHPEPLTASQIGIVNKVTEE